MTQRERLEYLIEIYGAKINGQYFADFDCPFTFDNGVSTRIKHIDIDADGDCYVIFLCDVTEKYYIDNDLTDNEINKILESICS